MQHLARRPGAPKRSAASRFHKRAPLQRGGAQQAVNSLSIQFHVAIISFIGRAELHILEYNVDEQSVIDPARHWAPQIKAQRLRDDTQPFLACCRVCATSSLAQIRSWSERLVGSD